MANIPIIRNSNTRIEMTVTTKILSPVERFRKIFVIMEKAAECVGANVLKESYRLTWLTWTVIGFIIAYFSFTVSTIYVGVVVKNDWTIMLQSLCYIGTGIQGCVKLLSAISHASTLRFLRSEIDGVYANFEHKHEQYQDHLKRSLFLVKRIIFTLLLIYCIAPLGLICVPLYYRYFLNQKIFIMQFFIPGIDPTTDSGYLIHLIVHCICVFFGSFGNFSSDFVLFILVAHIPLITNILKCKFDDLDEMLRKCPGDATKSQPLLKDIFEWHQKYIDYIDLAKNSFFWVIFVQIGTATTSIICTIVCQFLGVMPAGPIYLVYSFIIMYSYCALGNLVDISNDDVTTAVYDCLWYQLSVPEQKMLLIMLRESQKSEGMSIGGVSPLSLNTALQVTKSIYTVAMILNEFFD